MDLQLTRRVIVVAGGTGFLGSAIVQRLRSEGAVALTAARGPESDVTLDATSDASVQSAIEKVLAEYGRVDGLVVASTPSASSLDPSLSMNPRHLLQAFDEKTVAFMRLVSAVLPVMRENGYGRVVGISGQNALMTTSMVGSVRNAGLVVMAKNFADAHAGTGVTVNVVNPGVVSYTPSAEVKTAHGGESHPDDTAALVAFLSSPISRAISGESIAVGHRVRGATAL